MELILGIWGVSLTACGLDVRAQLLHMSHIAENIVYGCMLWCSCLRAAFGCTRAACAYIGLTFGYIGAAFGYIVVQIGREKNLTCLARRRGREGGFASANYMILHPHES